MAKGMHKPKSLTRRQKAFDEQSGKTDAVKRPGSNKK